MHTNDTHANLESSDGKNNAAKRVTAVKNVRAEKPNALLIDAGDVFSGTLYFNEFKGQADLALMNLMDYDLMTFGNHEFDLGSTSDGHKALADFVKGADFSFVSSNVDFSDDENFEGTFTEAEVSNNPQDGNIYNSIIKEVNGQKIGFIGLTTEETKDISSPNKIEFQNYIEEARKAVSALEQQGVNKIIAVTHLGFDDNPAVDNDQELAKAVEGIDVIIGGHSHTFLGTNFMDSRTYKPVFETTGKEPTVIVTAYQYNTFLGDLDVVFDENGKVIEHEGKLVDIQLQVADEAATAILKPYKDKVDEIKNLPSGATAVSILSNPRTSGDNTKPSVRKNETPLGNLITDAMLSKAREYESNVVMALQNGGGIRSSIDAGPINVGEIINVLPFGNTLALMEISGSELKEAFEISLKDFPVENGGFLHVSGAKVEYDSTKAAGQRIVSIAYKNSDGTYTQVRDDVTYKVATNAFTAKGGDGFTVFKKIYEEGRVIDLGLSDWENFAAHLKSLGTVDPKVEGRIIDVANAGPQSVAADQFSGTAEAPKNYDKDITVDITSAGTLENAVINGDLKLIGTAAQNFSFKDVKVTGNLDVSDLSSEETIFEGIEVNGETIL